MSERVRVRAAGVLPYEVTDGKLKVALVHRPHYDDWSWAKGKLDRGEDWAAAAVREAFEETGLRVRLGMPLPEAHYRVGSGLKRVRYWAATVVGGEGDLAHEIDEVAWLGPEAAAERLSYAHDRVQLEALVALHEKGRLETWPLLIVRHALAQSRGSWKKADVLRPLLAEGHERAAQLVGLIDAYDPEVVLSSPAVRCTATVRPFTESRDVRLVTKKGLSEEGYEADPAKLDKHLGLLLSQQRPAVLCTHRPLLPPVLDLVRSRAAKTLDSGDRQLLSRLRKVPLDKGEVLALTMTGSADDARVVAVERHRPAHPTT